MKEWKKSTTFWESYRYAWQGVQYAVQNEANFRRQLMLVLTAFVAAVLLGVPVSHFLALVAVSALVLVLEMLNTALEQFADTVHPEYHLALKHFKDISAGAVLVASLTAILIGAVVFIPPLLNLVGLVP